MASALPTDAQALELACFDVGGRIYGLDVMGVREIVRYQPTTPLPKAPALIEGVVDLRGAVIPVVSLARVLGGEASEPGPTERIAIVECGGMVLGLRVDAAVDVLRAHPGELEEAPALATASGYDAVHAVVRMMNREPVLVLSLEHVLESVHRSAPAPETWS